MENWNGYYTKDDPDDRLKPWDNPIVKEAIDTAKEEKDETLKIIAKAKAEIMEWISQQTEEERQEEEVGAYRHCVLLRPSQSLERGEH